MRFYIPEKVEIVKCSYGFVFHNDFNDKERDNFGYFKEKQYMKMFLRIL